MARVANLNKFIEETKDDLNEYMDDFNGKSSVRSTPAGK